MAVYRTDAREPERSKDARAALAAAVEMYGEHCRSRMSGDDLLLKHADAFLKWLDQQNGRI